MYDRFTDRARKAMTLANQEAQRFGHERIDTEHVLLGLVKEGTGIAAGVLKNADIDLRKIRLDVEKIVRHEPFAGPVVMGRLPHTEPTKRVVESAIAAARELGDNYVGTEHLLIGLLTVPEGVAGRLLAGYGVTCEAVVLGRAALVVGRASFSVPAPAVADDYHRLTAMRTHLLAAVAEIDAMLAVPADVPHVAEEGK